MDDPLYSVTPEELAPRDAYRLLVSIVVPRPIAWVSSMGADGTVNLAPFSFFNVVGDSPPTIMVSIGRRGGKPKDTLRNVLETGEFVVHIVEPALAEAMNRTSGDWPYGANEFAVADLAAAPSQEVRPPRLAAAPVALEARLTQVIPVQDTRYTMILGRVLRYHIRPDLLDPAGLVNATRLRPVARLGGDDYTTVEQVFTMSRPRV